MRTLQMLFCGLLAASAAAGDLETARQALHDGVLRSALAAADLAATNAATRSEARLVALEALARLEDDVEIRRRLAAWTDEKGEAFRVWRARAQVRVRDFAQAETTLAAPFSDPTLALSVACLRASMKQASGDAAGALKLIAEAKPGDKAGLAGEDARLLMGELLLRTGETKKAWPLLAPLAESAERREAKMRAGYALGLSEMEHAAAYTTGVERVRALLRRYPGEALSLAAAPQFAERLLAAGDAAGADDEYRRYLEANPAAAMDATILERRGRAFAMLGRRSEAATAFSRAEQLTTNLALKAEVAFRQGEMLLAEQRYAEAAGCYARSAGYQGGGRPELRFAEADAWDRAGDKATADRIYAELAKTDGPWSAKAKLRLTTELARQGKLDGAIKAYKELVTMTNLLSEAEITEAYLGWGRACYRDYQFKDAAKAFSVVAARNPKLADGVKFLLALCQYGDGKDIDAKASVAALMTTTSDATLRAELMLWCAKYEFNHKEYAEAQSHFEMYASLREATSQAEALLWAARCAFALTDYSKAVELATKAATAKVTDNAHYGEALLVQGEALMELGRYAEAVQVFDQVALRAAGEASALRASLLRADALYAMGAGDQSRYEAALSAYLALMAETQLSPDRQIEVAFKVGRALEKLHRTGEAMDQYYRGVVLPYSAGVNRGTFFAATSRTFFARAAFALADYHASAGDVKAALNVLGRVVAANIPASEEAQRKISDLKTKGGQ